MNCQDTRKLLDGYVDGEVDLVRHLEIERHLQECPACQQRYTNYQTLRTALHRSDLYTIAPPALSKRIHAAVRQAAAPPATPRLLPWRRLGPPATPRLLPWRRLGNVVALAATVLLVWGVARGWSLPSTNDRVAQEVTADHVRSLMVTHLADVASSDQHTVKPWFDGKLDFSPPVEDFAGQGFPLVGGRLDYLDNRPVAALVYQRRKHVINLFVWPAPGADQATNIVIRQGYYLVHWTRSGMTYWAVSDLNSDELQAFSHLLQQRATPNPTP